MSSTCCGRSIRLFRNGAEVEIYDVDLAAERMLQMALERKVVARGKRTDEIDVGGGVEVTWTFDGTEDDRLIDRYPRRFERLHQTLSGRRPELLPRRLRRSIAPSRMSVEKPGCSHHVHGTGRSPAYTSARVSANALDRRARAGAPRGPRQGDVAAADQPAPMNERQRKIIDRLLAGPPHHAEVRQTGQMLEPHRAARYPRPARTQSSSPRPRTHHELPSNHPLTQPGTLPPTTRHP